MTDLVYIFSAGSNTNEIKYSLRSFQKHLSGIGKLFIVGDDPGIFKGFTHIPMGNVHGFNLARNIYEKILTACKHPDVSDDFICASDDYFLLQDYEAARLPFYYQGDFPYLLSYISEDNYYKAYVKETYNALMEKELPVKYFNVHFPILYSKQIFIEIMARFNWEKRKSYISKSLYANSLMIEGEHVPDKKFKHPKTKTAILRQLRGLKYFSTDDGAMNEPMLEFLNETYPEPSRWEK
jgi:hypothetical protein